MANPPKLLSGRVPVVPLDQLSNTRYQFLGLGEAEPNLGNGVANSVLTIQSDGTRVWANSLVLNTANFSGNVGANTFFGNFVGNIFANGNAFITAPGNNTEILFNDSGNVGANSNLTFNKNTALLLVTGNINTSGYLQVGGNINSNASISAVGNITGGNVNTGQLSLSGNVITNLNVTSNVAANNFIVGNSVFATGSLSAAGNVIGGNISAVGNISGNTISANTVTVVGNITGNYITALQNVAVLGNKITSGTSTGILFETGNISLISSNLIVDGGYIYSLNSNAEIRLSYNASPGTVGIYNDLYLGLTGTGNITVPGNSNLWGAVTSNSTISAQGNISGNSLNAGNVIVATGNITGGNIITSGLITATGNIASSANLVAPRLVVSNITTNNNSLTISTDADYTINIHPGGNGTVDLNDHRITNLGSPVFPDDAVTKEYVDSQTSSGLHVHEPVKWLQDVSLTATYANGGTSVTVDSISGNKTLTFTTSPALAVDDMIVFASSFNGITGSTPYFVYSTNGSNQITLKATFAGVEITTLTNGGPGLAQSALVNSGIGATLTNAGANAAFIPQGSNVAANTSDRILVTNQANGVFNGVYTVTTVGNALAQWVFTRATDNDTYAPANTQSASAGDYFLVTDGTHIGDAYVLTDPTGVIEFGVSNITYTQFSAVPSYTGANGVSVVGLTISANVDNITTAISGGNIVVKDSAVFTTPNIGAATGESLSVTGNISANNISFTTSLTGNVANLTGNVTVGNLSSVNVISAAGNVSGNNLFITGLANIDGNLHALGNSHFGQNLSFTPSSANIQYGGTANSYLQLVAQNKDNGTASSTDFVATADNGNDNDTYIDMGINSSAYNQVDYAITGVNDGYVYVSGNTTTGGGQLILATKTAKDIVFATGGLANANLAARFQHGNGLSVVGNVYAPWFIGNVVGNVTGNIFVAGPNTGVVFNDQGNANSSSAFTFDKSTNAIVATGNLTVANLSVTGTITSSGNITSNANLNSQNASITSNITAGNLSLTGSFTSSNLNIDNSNISTTGNITAGYFFGNGSQLTGVITSVANIFNGNSNVRIDTAGGNIAANVSGQANLLVLAPTGAYVQGEISASGNITGNYYFGNGYFLTGISVDTNKIYNGQSNVRIDSANGNIQANVAGTANVWTLTSAGQLTNGLISATGNVISDTNVIANNFIGNANASSLSSGTVPSSRLSGTYTIDIFGLASSANVVTNNAQPNITSIGNLTSLIVTGNANVGNLETSIITAQGNITGANIVTSGSISAGGNITGANVNTGIISATGNITGANITTSGEISATGNITGNYYFGNGSQLTGVITSVANINNGTSNVRIETAGGNIQANVGGTANVWTLANTGEYVNGEISASGNITSGNVNTNGLVTATGNIVSTANVTGGNLTTSGVVTATGNITSGSNVAGGNIIATTVVSAGGNITGGNILTTGLVSATGNITSTANVSGNFILGNGYFLTGIITSVANINNGTSNLRIDTSGGNIQANVGGTANVITIASSGLFATNVTVEGNLTVNGNTVYVNVESLNVEDPIIGIGRGANNDPLTSNDGKDRGEQLWYYDTAEKSAFIGYDNSVSKLIAASNVTITNEVVTVNHYGNFVVGNLESSIVSATGNIITSGIVSAAGNITGNYFFGNGSSLTGLPTLTSVYYQISLQGNVTGNSSANAVLLASNSSGILYPRSGNGIQMIGNATSGVITISTIGSVNDGTIFGGGGDMELVSDPVTVSLDLGLITDLTITSAYDLDLLEYGAPTTYDNLTVSNLLSTLSLITYGNANIGNLTVDGVTSLNTLTIGGTSISSGDASVGNLTASGRISATGNVTGGNVISSGVISAVGNITGNFILGNGSQLSGLPPTNLISSGTSNVTIVSSNGNVTLSVAGNSNVIVVGSGQTNIKGNLVPDASNIYSLGTSTNRWSNLWVSGNTITLGNIVLKDENSTELGVYASNGTTTANVKAQIINTAAFGYNVANITASGNISNAYNTMSVGPITINSGVTQTVNSGAIWTIV
jgi:hypothetical protein